MTTRTHTVETAAPSAEKSTLPKTMRAVALRQFGGPAALTIQEVPVPELDPGDVLLAVHTAGVGPWDLHIRGGWYPEGQPRFPLVLGTDGSGTIAATGSRVRRLKVGERVYGYRWLNPKGGFCAEYTALEASHVAPIPRHLDMVHAGAMAVTGLTALQGIDAALHVKRGESVIICGASGGVGTLAVQFAKLRGARILALASGADGVDLVRPLGADAAVDGQHGDVAAAIQHFAPHGVDAVLALAGGEALERCLEAVRPGGRVAYPNGVEPVPQKRRGVRLTAYNAVAGSREFERLDRAAEAAQVEVPIAAEYPFTGAAQAHERIAAGHVLGKIVLRVR
jgi:NADPH:quinone reductase